MVELLAKKTQIQEEETRLFQEAEQEQEIEEEEEKISE